MAAEETGPVRVYTLYEQQDFGEWAAVDKIVASDDGAALDLARGRYPDAGWRLIDDRGCDVT